MKTESLCLHAGYEPGNGEPRVVPIVQSTTFKYSTTAEVAKLFDLADAGFFNSRLGNPTVDAVEQKIAALEAFETEDPDYSGYVKKDIFDKTASELAAKKKELNEKLTEDEQKKQKEQEEREELQSKYDKLLRESEVSKFKAKLLGMGYEEKLADATAEAMADGDTEKVFANQKKHLENVEKKVRAEALKDTPKPTPDGDSKTMTLEKLRKMSPQERYDYSVKNPEDYKALYTNNDTGGNE